MKITTVYRQEQFTFDSTGETIEPVCGVWGLGTDLAVFSGYDTEHYVIAPGDRPVVDMLTPAEAVELGEFMAGQWRAFADKHRGAAVEQADDKRLTPTEALRAGMVSVDDLAGIGERIEKARASAEGARSGTRQQEAGPTASECARRFEAARAELDAALSAYQQAIASADKKVGVVPFRQAEREAIEALNNRR